MGGILKLVGEALVPPFLEADETVVVVEDGISPFKGVFDEDFEQEVATK